jgi:protein transport protein SEC23
VKRDRFPTPRYVECDQGTSQARFVSAIVDPSVTHMSMNQAGEAVLTEDVNLEVFMDHLKKLAVQS